jgi:hypothetical protein
MMGEFIKEESERKREKEKTYPPFYHCKERKKMSQIAKSHTKPPQISCKLTI